jgi:hypothetical protein
VWHTCYLQNFRAHQRSRDRDSGRGWPEAWLRRRRRLITEAPTVVGAISPNRPSGPGTDQGRTAAVQVTIARCMLRRFALRSQWMRRRGRPGHRVMPDWENLIPTGHALHYSSSASCITRHMQILIARSALRRTTSHRSAPVPPHFDAAPTAPRAMETDPLLPPELLPQPWPGTQARSLTAQCWSRLLPNGSSAASPRLLHLYAEVMREAARSMDSTARTGLPGERPHRTDRAGSAKHVAAQVAPLRAHASYKHSSPRVSTLTAGSSCVLLGEPTQDCWRIFDIPLSSSGFQ